jgi:L-glutamine-phosphate cytidylyltransferase
MRAVILAAGRGSRLGAARPARPKCLTWLGGARLLDFQRRALDTCGLHERILVGGFAARRLRPLAGETLIVNRQWAQSGPIASLLCVPRDILRQGVVLVYGDCVFHADHLRALLAHPAALAMTCDQDWHALWSLRMRDVLSDAENLRLDGDCVTVIGGRAARVGDIQGQFTGLLKIDAGAWPAVEAVMDGCTPETLRCLDTTALLSLLIAAGGKLHAVPVQGRWLELDTRRDLALYRARLRRRQPWSHDWRRDIPA